MNAYGIQLRRWTVPTVVAFLLASSPMPADRAIAQDYPNRPIKLLVGFPPGGGTDTMARMIARKIEGPLSQPVVIENRPGANGVISTTALVSSPSDGYTLSMVSGSVLTINPWIIKTQPYDTQKDLTPIAMVATAPIAIAVHPSLPVKSVAELIALLKSKPDAYVFGAVGGGSPMYMSGELFKHMTNTKMGHVPYKGSASVVQDLLGGQIQIAFETIPPLMPHVQAGKLKMLAVGTQERLPLLPDVPTVSASGLPGFEAFAWYAVVGPARTPQSIVQKLNAEIQKAIADPEVRKGLEVLGAIPVNKTKATSEQLTAYIASELEKWRQVTSSLSITVSD